MKFIIFLFFLKCFIAYIETTKPNSINLQLETVLEFSKDQAADAAFMRNLGNILNKVITVLGSEIPKERGRRNFNLEDQQITFTDFILTAADIVNNYTDNDLEDAFAIFIEEIRKYQYKGCKFYELLENENLMLLIKTKLDSLKWKNAKFLRKLLDKFIETIRNAKFADTPSQALIYINSLYGQDCTKKFKNFLENLEKYREKSNHANMNLIKLIRDGIRSTILDHYSNLYPDVRKDLKAKIENTWSELNKPVNIEARNADDSTIRSRKETRKTITTKHGYNREHRKRYKGPSRSNEDLDLDMSVDTSVEQSLRRTVNMNSTSVEEVANNFLRRINNLEKRVEDIIGKIYNYQNKTNEHYNNSSDTSDTNRITTKSMNFTFTPVETTPSVENVTATESNKENKVEAITEGNNSGEGNAYMRTSHADHNIGTITIQKVVKYKDSDIHSLANDSFHEDILKDKEKDLEKSDKVVTESHPEEIGPEGKDLKEKDHKEIYQFEKTDVIVTESLSIPKDITIADDNEVTSRER